MKTKRKPVCRIDKCSLANKSRKVSNLDEVDVGHLDGVVSGSCSHDFNPFDSSPVVDAGYTISGDNNEGKINVPDIYMGESFRFQDTQPVSSVMKHLSGTSYRSTNLPINEPDPVTSPSTVGLCIGKGKRKADDLYNSSVHAFVAGSHVPEHYIPSLESIVCHVNADTSFHSKGTSSSISDPNNVENNVHIKDAMYREPSSLSLIENECSSPNYMLQFLQDSLDW